jgi:Putative addiction module component
MCRAREAIREDIFQLDYHEQALLAEEITEHLSKDENMKLWLEEAKRRLEEHRRGEGTSFSHEEVMARARKKIERAIKSD